MSADELDVAAQFLAALAAAAKTGDRDPLYPFLAADVEWLTPKRDLLGLDDVRENLTWLTPPDNLDVDFDHPDVTDLGDGRFVSEVSEIYRLQSTGEVAYTRRRRVELTIRERKIARYEMRVVA
jgi:ketosteroid isomerase-like protein